MPIRFRELSCRVYLLIHASYDINEQPNTHLPATLHDSVLTSAGTMIHYLFISAADLCSYFSFFSICHFIFFSAELCELFLMIILRNQ